MFWCNFDAIYKEWDFLMSWNWLKNLLKSYLEFTCSSAYVEEVKSFEEKNPFELQKLERKFQSIYLCRVCATF